jgi:hypothetical protein
VNRTVPNSALAGVLIQDVNANRVAATKGFVQVDKEPVSTANFQSAIDAVKSSGRLDDLDRRRTGWQLALYRLAAQRHRNKNNGPGV